MHQGDYSNILQQKIDEAATRVRDSHPKWPLVSSSVELNPGIYELHSQITLRSGVSLTGASQASTVIISCLANNKIPLIQSDAREELYAVNIEKIHFYSQKPFYAKCIALRSANRNCVIKDVFIENFEVGIELDECFTTQLANVGIYRCHQGLVVQNLTNGRIGNVKVENCRHHGIYLGPSLVSSDSISGTELRGVVCQGNGGCGVLVEGADHLLIDNLFLEGNNRAKMRRMDDCGNYAQLRLSGNRDHINKRNGNVLIRSLFVTPGKSERSDKGAALDFDVAEQVYLESVFLRNWQRSFSMGLRVSPGVTSLRVSGVSLEGWAKERVFDIRARYVSVSDVFEAVEPKMPYRLVNSSSIETRRG